MKKERKGGGSKLSRTEIVSVRLDPKLRYAAEIAGRKNRRTLSAFIEWAVERAVKDETYGLWHKRHGETRYMIDGLWHTHEAGRFLRLWYKWPELMTFDEDQIAAVINNEAGFHASTELPFQYEIEIQPLSGDDYDTFQGCSACSKKNRAHLGLMLNVIIDNWDQIKKKAAGQSSIKFKSLATLAQSDEEGRHIKKILENSKARKGYSNYFRIGKRGK